MSIISAFYRAGMVKLVDALDSGSSGGNSVQVRVLFPAPSFFYRDEKDFYIHISDIYLRLFRQF